MNKEKNSKFLISNKIKIQHKKQNYTLTYILKIYESYK